MRKKRRKSNDGGSVGTTPNAPHAIGDSHHPDSIGVAVAEEILPVDIGPNFEWVVVADRAFFHWRARYTLTREFNGKVLHSVTAEGFKDALEALRSLAIEDETVMWLCTCACSDKTHAMIDVALTGTRLGRWEPKH